MGRKSQLPLAQREEAVLSLLRKEEPVAALSRRYQVSEQTLYRWRDEFLAGGRARLGQGDREAEAAQRRIAKLEQELARRAQVIGELSIANDILKKLQAYPD
jgi:transposase-like protein